ncbi:MAG: glycosyltransferase [Candidatus Hydrogenedentes bacterium]|nr:glycosyltransferase [Candidatus Hydrogenedentota bacterium]
MDDTPKPRLAISEGLRRILDYRKFTGPTRMLVLETQYFFDRSWIAAAKSLGWQTATVPSVMTGGLTREQIATLFTAVGEFKPHFILTSNYAGMDDMGMFARFFEDARIPYVSWFTDTPRMILFRTVIHASPFMVAATWEKAYIPHFKSLGFEHVLFLPHATDPELFRGEPRSNHVRSVAFVGTSMIDQAEEAWEKLKLAPEMRDEVKRAFDQGRVTRESFAEGVTAILDPAILERADESARRNAELCLVYEATRRMRCDLVRTLTPLGIEAHGDTHWKSITKKAYGAVGYFTDLARFYRDTAVNLNTTSLQMRTSVNQRVFDCPAAGGFLLTDNQGDLSEFFEPNTESATFDNLDELKDKTQYYLKHPDERTRIVRAAQSRIAAHHTHAHRLQMLEAYLKERYA